MRRQVALVVAFSLGAAACAGDGGGGGPGPILSERSDEGGGRGGGLPNLFISPFGEPFRAGRGEPYPVAVWFAGADLNHDGRLDGEEFRRDADRFFRVLDADHDGVIDGFEITAYERSIAPEILPRLEGLRAHEGWTGGLDRGDGGQRSERGGRNRGGGGVTQGAGVFALLGEEEPVAAADVDLDGRVTRAEFLAVADRRFRALDTAGVGFLTMATLPKTPVQEDLERRSQRATKRRGGGG